MSVLSPQIIGKGGNVKRCYATDDQYGKTEYNVTLYTKSYMETNFRWTTFCEKQGLKHIEQKTILYKLRLVKDFLIKM